MKKKWTVFSIPLPSILPAVVCPIWLNTSALLAVADVLSLLPPLQYLFLCGTLTRDNALEIV